MIKTFIKLLTFILPVMLLAQSPGGVSSPVVWYRADALVYSNAGTTPAVDNVAVHQWNDFLGTGRNLLQATAARRPVYSNLTTLANFNPTVTFTRGSTQWMQCDPGAGNEIINRVSGTFYSAGFMDSDFLGTTNGAGLIGFNSDMDFPGLHTSNNTLFNLLMFSNSSPDYLTVSTNPFAYKNSFVSGASWQNGASITNPTLYGATTLSLNGMQTFYSGNNFRNVNTTNAYRIFRVGGDTNWGYHNGQLNEILIYQNILTPGETNRLESYLAIKYGTTLSGNYVSSGSTVVWTNSAAYQNNVFGIARDNNGALYQKQSRSENRNQKLIIGAGNTLASTNAANGNTLTDGQFLLVGDNNLAQSLTTPLAYTGGSNGDVNLRFASIWKVKNTNGVGQVTVAWPKGIKNLYLVQSTDENFTGGDTFTPMASETIVNGVAYNTATVTLADGQFFTLAGYMYAPGGVLSAAWYRADAAVYSDAGTTSAANNATIQQWNEFNGLGTNISQATVANRPVYSNSTTLTNFNPTVTFDGSNDILLYQPSTNGNVNILDRSKGALFSAGNITGIATMLGFGPASDDPGLYSFSGTNNLLLYPIVGEYDAISTGSTTGHYIGGGTWENGAGVAGNNSVLLSLRGNHQVFNTNIQNVLLDATRNDLRVGGDTDYARLNGQQNEVIIFPNKLTDDEVTKVESYLAVKYGQTLSSTQNRNYLSATGNVIWDGTNNSAYYNNIIGIGRENVSALNQKQSGSVNANQKLIIGAGSTLANTNAANTNTLTDGQFLLVGDNNLAQSLTTPLAYTGGSNGDVNLRFASIWKVQNTNSVGQVIVAWPKGINNLYLVQSTDENFTGGDTFTPMASETTVNGVAYNTATVTLADGQYFTLAGFIYAPGGVTSAAWYRADAAVYSDAGSTLAADNTAAQQWNDFNNKPFPLIQATAAQKPTFSNQSTLANFNPTVTFISAGHTTAQGGFMAADPGAGNEIINRTDGTIYTAGKMNTLGAAGLAGFNVDMNYPGLHTSNDATRDKLLFYSGTTYNALSTNLFAAKKPFVAGSSWLNGAGTTATYTLAKVWLDGGENIHNNTSANVNTNNTYRIFRIGRDTDWGSHDGQLNEAILFENPLSASEKARVDSYLAVKWGTTLIGDYVSSGSTVVWTTSATYQHNIFGIARDNVSALYQKQSRSENANQKLIIGAGSTLVNTNAANTNTLTDGQFLMVGDNNLAQKLSTTLVHVAPGGEVNNRFAAIWKVQNTGSTGQVIVAWPKGVSNLHLVRSIGNDTFDGTDTFIPMTAETTINGVVYNTATVTFTDGDYFTFAGFANAPGGVIGQGAWFRADAGVTLSGTAINRWDNQGNAASLPYVDNTGASATNRVTYNDNNVNFNPGLSFTGNTTDAFLRRTGTNVAEIASTSSYAHFTVARKRAAASAVAWHAGGGTATNAPKVGLEIDSSSPFNANFYISNNTWRAVTPVNNNANNLFVISRIFSAGTANDFDNGSIGTASVANHNATGDIFTIGATGANEFEFAGDIMEIISYPATITLAERERVNSYLGIKYGVTLGTVANPFTYYSSNGSAVWNPSNNTGYYNNVFGIGRDDISSLYQKQSRSENTSQKLIIGAGNSLSNTNAANANTLSNGQFLMVGDNGLSQSYSTIITGSTAFQRFDAIWKVQNTNSVGTVTVAWPQYPGINLVQSPDANIESTDTFTPMTGTATIGGVTYNTATVSLNNGTYFTFARALEDTDGDGVPDIIDLDNDNDGILDADECNGSDKITNGTFPTSGGNTSTVPGWTVSGSTVNLGTNGLLFNVDGGATTTLSQNLSGLTQYNNTIQINDLYWIKTNTGGNGEGDATARGVLTISYGGTVYATIDLGTGSMPSVTTNNGATSSISTLPSITGAPAVTGTLSAKTNMSLTFPSTIPANGLLEFKFIAGSHTGQVRDVGLRSVSLMLCADTDGDGTPDYLDLDSDDDGCFDAVEGAGNITRDQINVEGSINGAVDANGVPVLANGGQGIGDSRNAAVNACPPSCTKPGATGTALTSSVGILTKGEPSVTGWPEIVPNGYLVLDGAFKGMVITHMTTAQINALTPTEGMLVFDTDLSCVKLYRGTSTTVQPGRTGWVCIERICID